MAAVRKRAINSGSKKLQLATAMKKVMIYCFIVFVLLLFVFIIRSAFAATNMLRESVIFEFSRTYLILVFIGIIIIPLVYSFKSQSHCRMEGGVCRCNFCGHTIRITNFICPICGKARR